MGVAAVGFLVPARPVAAPRAGSTVGTASEHSGLFRLALAYGLFGFGYVITATFLIAIVRGEPSLRAFEPVAWLVVGLAALPSVLVWGLIGRRIGLERAYALSCAVRGDRRARQPLEHERWNSDCRDPARRQPSSGSQPWGSRRPRAKASGDPRRALGLMTVAFSIGQIVGPSFAGHVRDLTGSFALPTICAALALLLATALTAVRNKMKRYCRA